MKRHPELFQFPYIGRGDPDHTFRHPYNPSMAGDPIDGWFQLGTAMVNHAPSGRDVLRLTSASQGNQGLIYNVAKTESNNFNGYIDIQMDSTRESHESADGMGFFFSRYIPHLGSAMGISHTFEGLGIIIDTFSNSRSRTVPYMYAYVSDGVKTWNPDTDGGDTEITKGCQLAMNSQIRVYIQYIDEELHVGVALNPRNPNRWHTCFKASNVKLPFSGGGHFAFSGETGHFFAIHEVHDAVFVDESSHSGQDYHSEYHQQDYGHGEAYQHHDERSHGSEQKHDAAPEHVSHPDPASRIHRGKDAADSLSGSLDLQVFEVFDSISSTLKGMGEKDTADTKLRLDGVREVTTHLIKEMEKQKTDMGDLIGTLRHLKATAGDLTYASEHFASQLHGLHNSLKQLREKADKVSESHDDMHADIAEHHASVLEPKVQSTGILIMFLVMQCLLGAAVFFVNKMSSSSRKASRMV